MKTVTAEHRQSPRSKLRSGIQTALNVGGQTYPGVITDYTKDGFGLAVEAAALRRAQRDRGGVEVSVAQCTFPGEIRHSRVEEHKAVVGVRVQEPDVWREISFGSEDPDWDLIEDPETCGNIFTDLAYKGPEAPVEIRQICGEALLIPKEIRGDRLVLERFSLKRGRLDAGPASCRFELFQTCHAFETKVLSVSEKEIELERPRGLARLLRRETFRVRNGTGGKELRVELESSLLGAPEKEVRLYDYSEHGLSVIDKSGWALAPVGFPMESVVVRTPSGEAIRGKGVICSHRWVAEEKEYAVGIQFETKTDQDRTAWHTAILAARYPALAFNYEETDHKRIWELFDRSGYLGLKPRESFSYVYDITRGTWERMHGAGTNHCRRVLLRNGDQVVGHLQLDRIYPKTWCAHALAIDPKQTKTVGRDIYSVTTDVLSAEGAGYVISITESALKWNQRNYYEFVAKYRWPDHNQLITYQIHEAELALGNPLKKSPELNVRLASRWDLKRIARYFETHAPEIERDALGLDIENLMLEPLNSELSKHGLSRTRHFAVATEGGELVGFVLMESGTTGISLFGIQDTAYTYVLPEWKSSVEQRRRIQETLLAFAIEWYRERGVPTINIYFEENEREYWTGRGLKFIWEGVRWIGKCVASRRYHAYTQMMFGQLILRRSRRAPA